MKFKNKSIVKKQKNTKTFIEIELRHLENLFIRLKLYWYIFVKINKYKTQEANQDIQ